MNLRMLCGVTLLLCVITSSASAATVDVPVLSTGDGYFQNVSGSSYDFFDSIGASVSAHYQFYGTSDTLVFNTGYAQFSLSSAPAAVNIISATLYLNIVSAYLTSPTPSSGTINHASNSSGATGNASQRIGGDQPVGTIYNTTPITWNSFDITSYLINDRKNGYGWSAFSFDPNTSGDYSNRNAGYSFSSADGGTPAYIRIVSGPALTVSPSGPTYNNGTVTIAADSGAINGTWNGTTTGGTLAGAYTEGSAIILTATLPISTVVSSWGVGCDSTTATTCTIASLTSNTTISPVFAPTYTVTYNGNGNTGGTAPVDPSSPYTAGATVTVLCNTGALVQTGYTFNGWNTAADGSGTQYAPGATFNMPSANVILYAKWTTASTSYVCSDGYCGGETPCHRTVREAVYAAGTGTLILIAGETHDGNFSLNADKSLTLQGGWDSTFNNPNGGTTSLNGAPKAPQGSLTFQNLKITP